MLVDGKLKTQGSMNELLTRKISRVEIIAQSLSDELVNEIQAMALSSRTTDEGIHFQLTDMDKANEAAQKIVRDKGVLMELTPIKESLEDYFVREQMDAGVQS